MTTDPATDTLPPAHGADPRGIAGWLLLPVAGLVLTAAVGLSTIVDIARSPDMLSLAFTYRTSITIGVIGTAILWTMLPAVALVLLVLRNRHFPAAFVVTNVALAAFGVLDPFITAIDYGFSASNLPYAAMPAVWFLGWSWYMLTSARVKNTFVN
jgi:hypothetical protein